MSPRDEIAAARQRGRDDGLVMLAQLRGVTKAQRARQVERDIIPESFAPLVAPTAVPAGFVSVAALSIVCELTIPDLVSRFRPRDWREREHFVVVDGCTCFREAFLGELVGELAVNGQREAAGRLLAWLSRDQISAEAAEVNSKGGAGKPPLPQSAAHHQHAAEDPWYRKGQLG